MKYIVNFSGGLCSFWAAKRTVDKFGAENTVLLFADTMCEHPDLYAFNAHAETVLGVKITRVSIGLNPWQLFRREHMIGNDRFPICSTMLKHVPLDEWKLNHFELDHSQSNALLEHGVIVMGFDWTELHRVERFKASHPNWTVTAPMTEEPLWDKCKMLTEAKKLGFKTPQLYELGFPHNNCGGGCVRAGISHWVHLYKTLPDVFNWWATQEEETQAEMEKRGISNSDFTILKVTRNKVKSHFSLRELGRKIEQGEIFDKHEWGGCGCSAE